jgi:hypothetical protein
VKGEVTHKDGQHTVTCAEPGCIWTFSTPIDGDAAHELMRHEHKYADPDEVIARIKKQSMRDHYYDGEGEYFCKHWNTPVAGNGLTLSAQCGYPRDLHPQEGE